MKVPHLRASRARLCRTLSPVAGGRLALSV